MLIVLRNVNFLTAFRIVVKETAVEFAFDFRDPWRGNLFALNNFPVNALKPVVVLDVLGF